MITIVLLTHAGMGEAFAAALRHIFGTLPPALEVLEIPSDQPPEEGRRRYGACWRKCPRAMPC